jgi:hypothetical protein
VSLLPFYSFDTSAFINGRRDLLPPETFPTLWGRVEGMIEAGSIQSVDEVLHEDVQRATGEILRGHPRLVGNGSGRNTADPFVIALACVRGGVVVTEERRKNVTNPKIPDVCDALGIRCLTLVGFVREQGWTF